MCVALPWQIDRPELKILVGIFCQILEIMQELHNNQDVQAGCDAFVESGADLLPFKCVIQWRSKLNSGTLFIFLV